MIIFNDFLKMFVQSGGWAIATSSLGLIILGTLSLLSVWSALYTCKKGISHLKRLHQIPCHRCQYFTGDYRLKCTVQPTTACTDAAISCRDFTAASQPSQRREIPRIKIRG